MIKPIETEYRGYRFRSRLEARWAVFFDAAEVPWDFEREGFDVAGERYLPDFWLPRQRAFVEIKPREFHTLGYASNAEKALQQTLKALADGTGSEAFLITGTPNPDAVDHDDRPQVIGFAPQRGIMSSRFAECPHCERVSLQRLVGGGWDATCPCQGDEPFKDTGFDWNEWPPRIKHAMTEARRSPKARPLGSRSTRASRPTTAKSCRGRGSRPNSIRFRPGLKTSTNPTRPLTRKRIEGGKVPKLQDAQ